MDLRAIGFLWAVVVAVTSLGPQARAGVVANLVSPCSRNEIDEINARLAGRVLDFTNNHRVDRRIHSLALDQRRDLYAYLPPGYDGVTPFPLMIWLHGVGQDEKNFLTLVPEFDRAIRTGTLPPVVIVAPDGTFSGRPRLIASGSFYMNSRAGLFEDYIVRDVWEFATRTFCVRPERGATVLAGASMGGYGTYNLGFKHSDRFGVLVGIMPPLDIRYADCHDNYMADYDTGCNKYRESMRPHRVIARFYGIFAVRESRLTGPTVGRRNPLGMTFFSTQNPIELLDTLDIRPGQFEMFIGYSKKDEFNIDAQVEHFLDRAARRGIFPAVAVLPDGRHNTDSGIRFFPLLGPWLSGKLAPFVPPGYSPLVGTGPSTDLLTTSSRIGLFRRDPGRAVWVQIDGPPSPILSPGRTTVP